MEMVETLNSDSQDYPYSPSYTYAGSIGAITDATFITAEQKQGLLWSNTEALFGGQLL